MPHTADVRPTTARALQAAVNDLLARSGETATVSEQDGAFYLAHSYYTVRRAAAEVMDVDPTNWTPSMEAALSEVAPPPT